MPIDVKGRLNLRVAHDFLNRFRIRPGVDQDRSERMAALVHRQQGQKLGLPPLPRRRLALGDVVSTPRALGATVHRRGVEDLMGRAPEKTIPPRSSSPFDLLNEIAPEDRQDWDRSLRGGRLGLDLALDLIPAFADVDQVGAEIHVHAPKRL